MSRTDSSGATATPTNNLAYLLTQGLTIAHLANALDTTDEVIRAVLADPDTPMSESTRHTLATLTAGKVATANALVPGDALRERITRLTLEGCTVEDIARTVGTTPGRLCTNQPLWVDTTTGVGRVWNLTIDQVDNPHVPGDLTWGRLASLETMGWSRDDVEATIGPGLPNTAKDTVTRGVAQAVAAYWQAYSGRLNPDNPDLARTRRAAGVRTPADWGPPAVALWWPPADVRHLLDEDADWSCGASPRKR